MVSPSTRSIRKNRACGWGGGSRWAGDLAPCHALQAVLPEVEALCRILGTVSPHPLVAVYVSRDAVLAECWVFADTAGVDVLVTDPVTGRTTDLTKTVRRALKAMEAARVPYCVIGATALAVRGLPRMTADLDLVVLVGDAARVISALRSAGLRSETSTGALKNPEPMIVFVDPLTDVEVDLRCAAGDPETTVIDEAPRTTVFGTTAPVATLEQLLLLYLYSNQPKHLGDFARIVQAGRVDLGAVERTLRVMHPEMLGRLRRRISQARSPRPAPPKPSRKRR